MNQAVTTSACSRARIRAVQRAFSIIIIPCCLTACSLLQRGTSELDENPPDLAPELSAPGSSAGLIGPKPNPLPPPPLLLTREVRREIQELLKGDAQCIRVSLARREPIHATIKQIFTDEGVPLDLLNLAVVESRFLSSARSRAGAVGIWQFTRSTAKIYGLKIEKSVDQRTDTILATIAAARLLRDLYRQFQDWYLALAAYNAGGGAVQRALRRGESSDFWALARAGLFSKQTRDFVPRFIAATILMRTAERYGTDDLANQVAQQLERAVAVRNITERSAPATRLDGLTAKEDSITR